MADNKISSSKKEIYTKLLDIAEKYVDVDNTDFLKTGLFGYITESMAMMIRDSTFHKSMLYNESFLNTAVIPKSVYNWAKMFNVEVQKATPKYAEIDIIIDAEKLNSIMKNKTLTNKDKLHYGYDVSDSSAGIEDGKFLILDKENPIIAGEYYFALEHSILIRTDSNNNSNNYRAQYITSEYESTSFEENINKILTVKVSNNNVIIKARAYQYKISVYKRNITSTSFLNKQQTFTFEDQFCGASLFYEEGGKDIELDLQYSDLAPTVSKQLAFYNLTDEHELEILFKHGSNYFMPSVNSKLKLYIYTTKGLDAPTSFSSDATMIFNDTDLKSLPVIIQFNPINLIGGKNSPSISEIKQTIINEISTRNTITTKTDLDNYFSILTSLIEDINDGKVTFIKKRDDILRRIYNAYLLVRDNTDDSTTNQTSDGKLSACVPTNTLDVGFYEPIEADTNIGYSRFKELSENNLHMQIEDGTTADSYFVCPFAIYIHTDPVNYVKFIYNMTDSSSPLIYSVNSTAYSSISEQFVPISARLYRGFNSSIGYRAENQYHLTLKFTTTSAIGSLKGNSTGEYKEVSGSIKINNIKTLDIKEGCKVYSEASDDGLFLTTFEIPLSVGKTVDGNSIEFESNKNSNNYYDSIYINGIEFSNSEKFRIDFSNFTFGTTTMTNFIVETSSQLTIYQQLDDIIESNLIYDETTNKIIGIKEIPVVHSSFFNSTTITETRREGFIKQLFTYIEILKKNLNKLETSTFFNLKFYNTYGYSNLYSTPTTNLKLTMQIVLSSNDYNTAAIKAQIRSFIRKAVDSMNSNNAINISALISLLSNNSTFGQYISYIKFIGLNDTFEQYINLLPTNNETTQYPPEWLNLDATYLNDETNGISFTTIDKIIEG